MHTDANFYVAAVWLGVSVALFFVVLTIYNLFGVSKCWFFIPLIVFVFAILGFIYIPYCTLCDYGVDGRPLTFRDVFIPKYITALRSSDNDNNIYETSEVYVFVYNEKENSSSRGIRYSYITDSSYTTDISVIMAHATSDYGKIKAMIKKLPKNTKVSVIKLFRVKGYNVSDKKFSKITDYIMSKTGSSIGCGSYCLDEIPPIIRDLNEFTNEWYSTELFALDEEALYNSKSHVYRISYFPAFTGQIALRIEIKNDDTADLYYKISDGTASFGYGGKLIKSEKAEMNKNEIQIFLEVLDKANYWKLPKKTERLGCDGHSIVIEGVKDGEYHIIDRWSPEETDTVYSLERYFFDLIKQKFDE